MLTILDIINNDNFIDYDFSIHVYRTVNSGEKHINIDIRGQKSSLESTNKRESSFDIKQAKTLASELGGGLVIKDHSKGNLHITLYFPDYQFYINPNEDASTIPVSLTPNSVLIVDDDPAIVDLLADFCESYGIRSIKAENGQQALEVFEAQQPSCVITDILMPQVSGIEVLKKMSGKGSRLIGLSGASSPNIRNEAMSAGADSFYSKPPNLAKMITEVKAATKGKKD